MAVFKKKTGAAGKGGARKYQGGKGKKMGKAGEHYDNMMTPRNVRI